MIGLPGASCCGTQQATCRYPFIVEGRGHVACCVPQQATCRYPFIVEGRGHVGVPQQEAPGSPIIYRP